MSNEKDKTLVDRLNGIYEVGNGKEFGVRNFYQDKIIPPINIEAAERIKELEARKNPPVLPCDELLEFLKKEYVNCRILIPHTQPSCTTFAYKRFVIDVGDLLLSDDVKRTLLKDADATY